MKPIIATIHPDIETREGLAETLAGLTGLDIHCEAKDFGRPPPYLAALFELLAGRPFDAYAGATLRFEREAAHEGAPPRQPVLWLRIDTPRGDLASGSGRRIALSERLGALAPRLAADLAGGRALLVLDWSHEDRQSVDADAIANIAARHGIGPRAITILARSAEPVFAAGTEIAVIEADAFIPNLWRLLFGPRVRSGEFRAPFGFAAAGPRARTHRYVWAPAEASAVRANLAARLAERDEPAHLAFPKDRFLRNMPGSEAFRAELDRVSLFHERGDNHARVEAFLATRGNLAIAPPPGPAPRHASDFLPVEALRTAMLQIVCAAEMTGPRHGLAPDLLKALVAGLPFVLFDARHTLARLADTGLDVLADFVDHAYDDLADPGERFEAAYEALTTFLARPPAFTVAEQDRLVNAATHNRRILEGRFLSQFLARPLRRIEARHPARADAFAPPPHFDTHVSASPDLARTRH